MKFRAGPSQLKQYSNKYPEKQVITMLDLAKYMEIYQGAPDVVSRGKQKMLQAFAEQIKKEWQKSDEQFNAFYYRRVVAFAMVFSITHRCVNFTKEGFCSRLRYLLRKSPQVICPVTI